MKLLSVDELLAAAQQQTGLSNFGQDNFREGLDHLIEGIIETGNVRPERVEALNNTFIRLLINRLRWQKDLSEHPEIADEKLVPPLVIVSLPRVGTTKLQRLLSVTDDFQHLPYWQILMCGRIHNSPDFGREHRIAETERYCNWRVEVEPDVQKAHRITALEPEEDSFLHEIGFRSAGLGFLHPSEKYQAWFAQQDIGLSYDILKAQLQYLQWQFHGDNPKPWVLKTPPNLGNEDQLQRIFPEGMKLICPHREPASIFTTITRMIETYLSVYYQPAMSRKELGTLILEAQAQNMGRHLQWRESNRTVDILDLSFKEICADSVATAEKVYAFMGLDLTDQDKQQIASWDQRNPRHKDGIITETLENYGLTADQVNERLADYRERFSNYL